MVDLKLKYETELITGADYVNSNGHLTVPYIYRIIQDAAALQLYTYYDSLEYLKSIGKAYVILRMNIKLFNTITPNEKLKISTWERSKGPVKMYRNYCIEDTEGNRLCDASSLWTFLDLTTRRPISTKNIPSPVMDYDEEVCADSSVKLNRDENSNSVGTRTVTENDIDLYGHMNNIKYVDCVFEYLPNNINIKEFSIEFVSECKLGEKLNITLSETDGLFRLSGIKSDGTVSFVSEIITEV